MSARHALILGSFSFVTASLLLAACASKDESALEPDTSEVAIPEIEAGAPDAVADVAEPCPSADCEHFPAVCTPDVLCLNGLFNPVDPSIGPDWRTRVTSLGGRSATDAWLVGTVGMAAHFDGTSWAQTDVGTFESLRFFVAASGGELSFGTLARIYTRGLGSGDGGVSPDGWALRDAVLPPGGYSANITATWSMPTSSLIWLATDADVWRLEIGGGTLTSRPGLAPSVCKNVPCRWLRSLHGVSSGTVWGVGDNGAAIRILGADGETPELAVMNALTWKKLSGVWAVSDTEAWAVGAEGTVIHNAGAQFTWEAVSNVPTKEHLNAIAGSSASDIWAVGNAGVVLHFDGTAWSRVKIAGLGSRRPDLYSVWSPAPGRVWIGGLGVLLALGDNP